MQVFKGQTSFDTITDVDIAQEQNGVQRINCFDSLDRTNVIQNLFAKENALNFLEETLPDENFKSQKPVDKEILEKNRNELISGFIIDMNNLWAENADALSKSQTCTPSLKTDFTRMGYRTIFGIINDVINSTMRHYYCNIRGKE